MNLSAALYQKSPLTFQNLAVSAYGFYWKRRRFGGIFESERYDFQAREQFSEQQFRDFQTQRLRKLLTHAFEIVPFYREIWHSRGIKFNALQKFELEDLPKLPFLEKNSLRRWGATEMISRKRGPGSQFFGSSGSTGTPVQILFSSAMHQRWSAAYEVRVRHWAGLSREMPRGMIGGRRIVPQANAGPPFYRYNRAEKQTYFSAYHISADHAADYLEGMKKHRVAYMSGYAMSNFFLARFLESGNFDVPALKAVLPSSESLTPAMRQTFQKVYGCKTFDAWSGVEACGLVSECGHGRLHISPDVGILEFLDPETGHLAPAGALAEIVCTGLLNFDQPLVRYRIGDLMRLAVEPCPCGRAMPVVQEIVGRKEDVVVAADGRAMVRFHSVFLGIPEIVEGQIVQHAFAEFEVKLVCIKHLSPASRALIEKRMRSQLGEIKINLNEVGHIPRGPNGKFKAVVSLLKTEEAEKLFH